MAFLVEVGTTVFSMCVCRKQYDFYDWAVFRILFQPSFVKLSSAGPNSCDIIMKFRGIPVNT